MQAPHLIFFFFNDTATTEIYTLSLHDALPILNLLPGKKKKAAGGGAGFKLALPDFRGLIASIKNPWLLAASARSEETRLNSSHSQISYAVFCLKKKKPRLPSCVLQSPLDLSRT